MDVFAISYLRFSSPEQRRGDSYRRQTKDSKDWCDRNKVTLNENFFISKDLGKSAYVKPKEASQDPRASFVNPEDLINPDRKALADLLVRIRRGEIPRGTFLIVEALDRLSRDDIVPALNLLTSILLSGVKVVQLRPVEQIMTDKADSHHIFLAVMELARGHSESAMKSVRISAAWSKKREEARQTKKPLTAKLPAWLEKKDGEIQVVANRAKVVNRIFELAANGCGVPKIVATLTNEKVEPMGNDNVKRILRVLRKNQDIRDTVVAGVGGHVATALCPVCKVMDPETTLILDYATEHKETEYSYSEPRPAGMLHLSCNNGCRWKKIREVFGLQRADMQRTWNAAYVRKILNDRSVLGEYQPKTHGKNDGEPIEGFYPAIVSKELFAQARAGAKARNNAPHKDGKFHFKSDGANLFSGLMRHARDGDSFYFWTRKLKKKSIQVIINRTHQEGKSPCFSFPYPALENGILARLEEVKSEDLGASPIPAKENLAQLQLELEEVRGKLQKCEQELDEEPSEVIFKAARKHEARVKELKLQIEATEQVATNGESSWSDALNLLEALRKSPDQEATRLRLRQLFRRFIESIWILVLGDKRKRLAWVNVHFSGNDCVRRFHILYEPQRGKVRARWWCSSILKDGFGDLRDPKYVENAVETLSEYEWENIKTDEGVITEELD